MVDQHPSSTLGVPLMESDTVAPLIDEDGYKKPHDQKLQRKNFFLLVFGVACFKVCWETLHAALLIFVLERLGSILMLAILLICFGVCQSVGSIAVTPLTLRFRAAKVLSTILVIAALTVSLIIILEASTGGTLRKKGTWNPFLIFPIASALAGFEGMIEVTRRLIPPLIVSGEDDKELGRINATVHLSLGLAGTVGALIAFPLIEVLSYVYALVYVPVSLGVAALLIFFIQHKMPATLRQSKEFNLSRSKAFIIMNQIVVGIVTYFKTIVQGAREIVDRKYWFILITFTLPQIIYFWVEMLLLPVYADRVLLDGALVGVLLASVDFGEFCGAIILLIFGSKVPTILLWTRLFGVFLNIYWLFPFVVVENSIDFVFAVMPLIIIHNACFSTNDVSMLSYIQASFPEDEKNPENDKLSKVIGFLYTTFVICASLSTVGIAIFYDDQKTHFQLRESWIYIPAIIFSLFSFIIVIVSFVIKLPEPPGGFKMIH